MHAEERLTSDTGGQKGTKKARFGLIPPDIEWLLAEHYGRGAEKYDDGNWQKGYNWHLSYDAARRHLSAFWNGEDYDDDPAFEGDQPLHIIAALWHCCALAWFSIHKPEYDDRPHIVRERALASAQMKAMTQALAMDSQLARYGPPVDLDEGLR